jgi:hypothetical protein
MAWDKGVPGLVARAYHRVKCGPARDTTRPRRRFFASRHSQSAKTCINLLPARKRADHLGKISRRLSPPVHFAFISLNAG